MQDVEPKNAKDAAVDQDQRRAATWPGGKSKVPTKVVQKKKRKKNTFLAYLLAPTSWCSTIWSNPLDFNGIENSIELNRLLCFWDRLNSRAKPIGKWYIRFTMQAALKMEITNSFRIRRPTAWGKDSAFLSLQTFRKLFHNGKHIEGLVLNTLWRLDPTTAVEIISASECHCFSLECILENSFKFMLKELIHGHLQRWQIRMVRGCEKFLPAVA